MAKYKPHYKVHRGKAGLYMVQLNDGRCFGIARGTPAGTKKPHYYTNTVWYPTLRDAIFSII